MFEWVLNAPCSVAVFHFIYFAIFIDAFSNLSNIYDEAFLQIYLADESYQSHLNFPKLT